MIAADSPRQGDYSQSSARSLFRVPLNIDTENGSVYIKENRKYRRLSFLHYYTFITTSILFILVIVLYCVWGTQSKATSSDGVS